MAFVKYTNTGSRLGTPKISIWTRGQIGFNQAAVLKYDIESYKYVVLYFDPDEEKIGVRVTNDKTEEGAIKMIVREGAGASFSAVSFLRTYDVDFTVTKRYEFEYVKTDKMFVFQPKMEKE